MEDMIKHLPNWSYHYASVNDRDEDLPDGLFCMPCSDIKEGVGLQPHAHGVSHYDFNQGYDFAKSKKLPREFSNLKAKIADHMKSQKHMEISKKEREIDVIRNSAKFRKESLAIGRVLGMNAYKSIKMNKSQKSFETEMTCDYAKDINVGTKNHSRKFPESMTHSFNRVLTQRLRSEAEKPLKGTGRPSAISPHLDKYTPNRNTLDIVGANMFMHDDLQQLFISADVVKDHTGLGIAKALHDTLSKTLGSENWKSRYYFQQLFYS